jgi:hypothetical protein
MIKSLKTLAEKLKETIDAEENNNFMDEWFSKLLYSHTRGLNRVSLMIENLKDDELYVWMKKFFKWEEKYEELQYNMGIITSSNIFNSLFEFIYKKGTELKNDFSEDFLSGVYEWRGYVFKIYQGQGCFFRVIKDDKYLFQSY